METSDQPGPSEAPLPGVDLIPARMVNEVAYCPRLFALEWLHGEWADSADTIEGRTVHRRVDEPTPAGLPAADSDQPDSPTTVRSVLLSDQELGVVARIDLAEVRGDEVIPIDYKKGTVPSCPAGAWEPEQVQLCAQGLLLRAHGYRCDRGFLWFAGSRRRVEVCFDANLIEATLRHIARAREIAAAPSDLPPPLNDSPKCHGCSLVGICLPDEIAFLKSQRADVRPLVPPRDDALPLWVQQAGGSVSKDGFELVVRDRDGKRLHRARFEDTSSVVILGSVGVTTPALHALAERGIPVSYHSIAGWYRGSFHPATDHGVFARAAQHRIAADPRRAIALGRRFVHGKIRNCRVLLRRNGRKVPAGVLAELAMLARDAENAPSTAVLLGIEGRAARVYFGALPLAFKSRPGLALELDGRNRRPPRDPANALLSFAYSCLVREVSNAVRHVGLDLAMGFLHQPRAGRPALALDLMEELRPVVADSAVLLAINNGIVGADDFQVHPTGVALREPGRKRFIEAFERRLDEAVTHPIFGTRVSMRRVIQMQVRLLTRYLLGEIPTYPEYRIR